MTTILLYLINKHRFTTHTMDDIVKLNDLMIDQDIVAFLVSYVLHQTSAPLNMNYTTVPHTS